MHQFYPDIIYKYPPQVKHVLFNDADIIKWGELTAAAYKNLLPLDMVEIYFRDNNHNKLFYSSIESSEPTNNEVSTEIANIVISSKDIFRFPYYNRDKYPALKYSDVLMLGRSVIGVPIWYNNKCIGAVVLSSRVADVFRDDIVPLLAAHAHHTSVIYKALFEDTAILKDSIKAHAYFNNIPDPIFVCNASSELVYFNTAFEDLMHEAYEDVNISAGESLEYITGNDFPEFRENIILAYRNGNHTFRKKYLIGGAEVWYSIELYKDKNDIICWCRKLEEATTVSVYSNTLVPALYAQLPFAIVLLNEKTEIVFANDYFLNTLGYNSNEVLNKSAFGFFNQFDYASNFSTLHKIFAEEVTGSRPYSFSFIAKNKEKVEFGGEISKVNYEGRECALFYGSDALVRKENLTEEININAVDFSDSLPTGIAVLNDMFICKYANDEVAKLGGYTREELSYFNFFQVLFEANFTQKLMDAAAALQTNEAYTDEVPMKRREEGELYVAITIMAREDADNQRYFTIALQDITTREIEKQDLMHTAESALDTQQAEEQFLARMSHEIRTAMNGIIGLTNVLMESGLPGEQQQFLNLIKHSTDNLLVIINDILDLSKIKSGKLQFEFIPIQLKTLFENLYSITLPKVGNKEINYRYQYDEDIPALLETDPVRLNQVILNLLSNAIKFTDRGRIEYSAKLLSNDGNNATVLIEVTDSGIGMDDAALQTIFESYKQADKSTTRKYGGTGLGLPIVKQLVDMMGGKVYVKSAPGRGTTFSVELTMKVGKAEQAEEETLIATTEVPPGIKVLVTDDNYINRLLVIHLLQAKGFDVVEAASGYEALDILREDDIDVVLMDISMPDMDGFETTKIIRKSEAAYIRNVPVIAMTAHGFQEQIKDAREAGMNDYIVKPFKPEQLYKIILKQLNEEDFKPASVQTADEKLYDLTFLNDYYDHEESLVNNILGLYVKDTPASLMQMEEYLHKEDWAGLKAQAHKIKTNIMMMGVRHVEKFFKESSSLNPADPHPQAVIEEFTHFKNTVTKAVEQIAQDRLV